MSLAATALVVTVVFSLLVLVWALLDSEEDPDEPRPVEWRGGWRI